MANITDIANDFVRAEIEEYIEQPSERDDIIATYVKIS